MAADMKRWIYLMFHFVTSYMNHTKNADKLSRVHSTDLGILTGLPSSLPVTLLVRLQPM